MKGRDLQGALPKHRPAAVPTGLQIARTLTPRYPGVPPDEEPKAGKSLASKLDNLIILIRSCPGGSALTQREVATVINHQWFRQTFKITEYRHVSVSAMSDHHVKLRKRRTIKIIRKAVRYREGLIWHLDQAAEYRTGLGFMEGNELLPLLRHGIMVALERDMDEIKRYVQVSLWDAVADEIDLSGEESPLT
jgi:hypothetical protein